MSPLLVNALALVLGSFTGSISGFTLIQQATSLHTQGSRYVALFPLLRMLVLIGITFYILHWGAVPFILFGVSMMMTMWVVILSSNL